MQQGGQMSTECWSEAVVFKHVGHDSGGLYG